MIETCAKSVPPILFTLADAECFGDEWSFNCGPAAICAICSMTPSQLRPYLGDFERKGYTNPTLMTAILDSIDADYREVKLKIDVAMRHCRPEPWPIFGLARVQWEGQWTNPGVPMAARYRHTHWVGAARVNSQLGNSQHGIFDVNCLNNGTGWVSLKEWESILVPWLLKEAEPKANGKWHLTHVIEVAR